jgi:hypothetical protein
MEIPLNAQVECTDGICGRSVYVLINPATDLVTHLVVKEDSSPHAEYIVPLHQVFETNADMIRLSCSMADLEKMNPFINTEYIQEKVPEIYSGYGGGMYGMGLLYYLPYAIPDRTVYEKEEIQQVPPGELTVHRGTRVEATDGFVGKVDEFVVNPENGKISHLVMREGHLWGQKDVIIPLSALSPMGKTYQDTVALNLNKHQIESLPTFSLNRRWS